jgi:phosphoglycerol transferase MdoB-like AlkP superfamily enzyme
MNLIKKISAFSYLRLFSIFSFFITTPVIAQVETPQDAKEVLDLLRKMLMNYVLPFIVSLALVVFLVGVLRFVGAGDNEEKRQSGRAVMIYGIVTLFVMLAVWGLVGIFTNTFTGKGPVLPNVLPELQNPN